MPRFLPRLNAVKAFEAAARRESFTAAADELNVSHAAISRHVRGLEKDLGVQLFKQQPRGVKLTELGRRYLSEVSPALDRIALASEALRDTDCDVISLSCEPTFALKWLMPRLGGFRTRCPGCELELVATGELADIARNEFDLAIRHCPRPPESLRADLISRSPVFPFASPAIGPTDDPAELLAYPLLHEDDGRLWRRWFEKAGIGSHLLPPSGRPFSSMLAMEGALAGQGIVLASRELAASDVEAGRLQQLSEIGLAYGSYYLLCRPETARRKPIVAFRQWLMESTREFREESG